MRMEENLLFNVLTLQLSNNFFLDINDIPALKESFCISEKKVLDCLQNSSSKYIEDKVNPYNSVQYCVFLYFLAHELYSSKKLILADKVYYLNKMLNSVDLFYAISLPNIWYCEHPLGSIMGRAVYGDYFFFYQGCTVGGNHTVYPKIGTNVTMYSNSKILGNCNIGSNVVISANCYIKDTNIPDNMMVFGQYPNLIMKTNNNTDSFWCKK